MDKLTFTLTLVQNEDGSIEIDSDWSEPTNDYFDEENAQPIHHVASEIIARIEEVTGSDSDDEEPEWSDESTNDDSYDTGEDTFEEDE